MDSEPITSSGGGIPRAPGDADVEHCLRLLDRQRPGRRRRRLDRADAADERRRLPRPGELTFRCGDDEEHGPETTPNG